MDCCDGESVQKRRRFDFVSPLASTIDLTAQKVNARVENDQFDVSFQSNNVRLNEESDESESAIFKLNFDCLTVVMSYLDVSEQVIFAQVCMRWKCVCETLWKHEQRLDFRETRFKNLLLAKRQTLRQFLQLCPNVIEIVASIDENPISVGVIVDSCRQLKRLFIHHSCRRLCWARNRFRLTKECTNLESFILIVLKLENCSMNVMETLISKAPLLKEIYVEGDIRGRARWMKLLSRPLKSLYLGVDFHPRFLISYLEKYGDQLLRLSIDPLVSRMTNLDLRRRQLTKEKFDMILSLMPNIIELTLGHLEFAVDEKDEHQWSLMDLTHLNLFCFPPANEYLLMKMMNRCPKLSHLNFSNHSFSSRCAKHLESSGRTWFTPLCGRPVEKLLQNVPRNVWENLVELVLARTDLSDQDCFEILRQCTILELLDVSHNHRVTNATFNFACDLVRKDCSRTKLSIKLIGCSSITKREVDVEPSIASRISFVF